MVDATRVTATAIWCENSNHSPFQVCWTAYIVEDPSKDISSTNQAFGVSLGSRYRKMLMNSLVWMISVVVGFVFLEYAMKLAFIQDQDLVQTFLWNRAYPPYNESIRFTREIFGKLFKCLFDTLLSAK
jgi:hypothetical protein